MTPKRGIARDRLVDVPTRAALAALAPLATLVSFVSLGALAFGAVPARAQAAGPPRARARDLGVAPGIFKTGPLNAITDVSGVRVGQVTLREGDRIRTGVTAILPHGGNAYLDRVPAAVFVGNGFGKLCDGLAISDVQHIRRHAFVGGGDFGQSICVAASNNHLVAGFMERDGERLANA